MKTLGFLLLGLFPFSAQAKVVRYELTAAPLQVNLSGKKTVDFALAVNGGIPAPTLEFTEGDDAEIVVRNRIPGQDLSIHWHGLLLPPEMDGVTFVNTPPIPYGTEFTFRFRIRQNGTYWYHSHTGLQEQKGVFGALVIHPKKRSIAYDQDVIVVLSDWSDEDGERILRNLRKDGDYYLYKKGTMRSWLGALRSGRLGSFVANEWTRMGGMDYSDVGYDAFLINGKRESRLAGLRPGQKARVRIINAAASSYFHLALGQEPMKVISADGIDVQPVLAREILIGMAETYDLLFEPSENKSYELRATAQDGTGTVSGWLGAGDKVLAPVKATPDLYAPMDHGGPGGGHEAHAEAHGHSAHHSAHTVDTPIVDTLTVDGLKALQRTVFPETVRVHEVKLVLGGDMERYIWHINNRAIHQDRNLLINEGDIVRFTFVNDTMMHHPMHLHGHFFRVLNQNGDRSPLKHTVDMAPHLTRTIEFRADEPGEWMLHCHNLYHMKSGMARVVKYSSFTPRRELARIQHRDHHLHDPLYHYGSVEAATNHAQAYFRGSTTWDQVELRLEGRNTAGRNLSFREPWELEGDLFYRRWFGPYLSLAGGASRFDRQYTGNLGASYTLPMLIRAQAMIGHRGEFRVEAEKRFQWTSSVFTDVDLIWRPGQARSIGHDFEFEVSLLYSPGWSWAGGLMWTDRSFGAGVQFQF